MNSIMGNCFPCCCTEDHEPCLEIEIKDVSITCPSMCCMKKEEKKIVNTIPCSLYTENPIMIQDLSILKS